MASARVLSVVSLTLFLAVLLGTVPLVLGGPAQTGPLAEVAGSYYRGDGLGVNQSLMIEPGGSYGFSWRGCLGTYASSTGQATLRDGELVLTASSRNKESRKAAEESYLPVRWGGRLYLIEKEAMMGFINEVNLGTEPRNDAYGLVYLRQEDWKVAVSDPPDLPPSYQQYLLKKPAEGAVLRKIEASGAFKVDFGLQSGLAPGMALVAEGEEAESFCELEVVSAAETTLIAKPLMSTCGFLRPGNPVTTGLSSLPSPMFQRRGRRWVR
ncbi:MAG: hypothetical protein ACJ76Y_05280 [Thermoanaerobaculia bacterium]